MKIMAYILFLCVQMAAWGQSKYTDYNALILQFSEAENFEQAEVAYQKIKTFSCPIKFEVTLAILAINNGQRQKALHYLANATRFGYKIYMLETMYPEEYKKFTPLSIDSISENIKRSQTIAFDWQTHLYLNDVFAEYKSLRALPRHDTNARELVAPLRKLMYNYMRQNGYPNDCEVGFGMSQQTTRIIMTTSIFLADFEFEELDNIMLQALKNYQITVDLYTFVADFYFYKNGSTSRYGTYQELGDLDFDEYLHTHLEEINARRKTLGLKPI